MKTGDKFTYKGIDCEIDLIGPVVTNIIIHNKDGSLTYPPPYPTWAIKSVINEVNK